MNNSQLNTLIQAEKAFSALSAEKGIRTAFITYLDDDAILFMPEPVKGKQKYKDSDSIPGLLLWEPQFAEISYSGNLGYTTGPWKLNRNSETAYGHFVSVWQKKDDQWKVILDTGIDYPDPFPIIKNVETSASLRKKLNSESSSEQQRLLILDSTINSAEEYKNRLSEHIIFLRMGLHPLRGINDVVNHVTEQKKSFSVEQQFQRFSDNGDLAYSYGYFLFDNTEKHTYLRIWTKTPDSEWKLALELAKSVK